MVQLVERLQLNLSDSAVEKWEKNQNRPIEEHRQTIVQFLGFDPDMVKTSNGIL